MDEKRRMIRNRCANLLLKSRKISDGFESSWSTHSRMFGDIMEPAFTEDTASRLELVSALNLISAGKHSTAARKLEKLFDACRSDEDFAALNFFMGVCCEKMGLIDMATVYYGQSAEREPEFYMVYLMLAKCLHSRRHYEAAAGTYFKTLDAILSRPKKDEVPAVREAPLLGSVHGNLASCLIMMRRYDDAEFELYEAQRYDYAPAQMLVTWATLYAATGRRAQAAEKMSELRKASPELEAASALSIREIIEQKNPRFAPRIIDGEKLGRFWDWFCKNADKLKALAFGMPSQILMEEVYEQLSGIFDAVVEKPGFELGRDGVKARMSFFDNYNLTFELWLGRLVNSAPRSLRGDWSFYSIH